MKVKLAVKLEYYNELSYREYLKREIDCPRFEFVRKY